MADPDPLIGQRIDNYEVKALIGQGGMAAVYLARDIALERDVVIKTMLPALAQNEELRLRFLREARATAQLHHPNIVPIYTTGMIPSQQPYIALQYIEGGSLSDYLQQLNRQGQWVSTIYALAIVRQIADALIVAHQANIIHRDIKPGNILLRNDGTPVLSDLGIAAVQQATTRLTQTGGIIGTPDYMSPEQASSQLIDGRSDIYSLGVILYELLSGHLPFNADSPWAMVHNHIYEKPAPLEQVRPDLTAQTYRVVATCLQKKRDDRYQNAQRLVAALDGALAAEDNNPKVSVGSWQPPMVQKLLGRAQATRDLFPAPWQQRKRPWWLYVLLGMVLLLVAGIVLWPKNAPVPSIARQNPLLSSPTQPASPSPMPATSTLRPTATVAQPVASLATTPPEASPAAETIVPIETATPLAVVEFTVQATQGQNDTGLPLSVGQNVFIEYVRGSWQAGPSPTWPMVGPAGDAQVPSKITFPVANAPIASLIAGVGQTPAFFVGEQIHFQSSANGVLWLGANDDSFSDNQGSITVRITLEPMAAAQTTEVPFPDGLIAYSCGSEEQNQIYLSAPDGSSPFLLPNQPPNSMVPAFSPDGMQIAFRSNATGSWQVYVSHVDGTNLRPLTNDSQGNNYEAVWSPNGSRLAFVSDRTGSRQIFIMNSDGTNQQRLTFNEAYNDDPAWSRHDRIIYESDQDGRFNIYQLSPQGGTPQLLISLGESATTPAWSADGQWLAFESREGEARHLWIATGEGANQQRVTAEGSNNQRPAWSPDGTRLAFHSNYQQPNDSLADIWTIHRETKALQRLTFRGDCLNPAWSRPGASATPGSTDSTANVAVSSDITSWPISETGVDWVGGGRLRPNRALPLAGYGNHAC